LLSDTYVIIVELETLRHRVRDLQGQVDGLEGSLTERDKLLEEISTYWDDNYAEMIKIQRKAHEKHEMAIMAESMERAEQFKGLEALLEENFNAIVKDKNALDNRVSFLEAARDEVWGKVRVLEEERGEELAAREEELAAREEELAARQEVVAAREVVVAQPEVVVAVPEVAVPEVPAAAAAEDIHGEVDRYMALVVAQGAFGNLAAGVNLQVELSRFDDVQRVFPLQFIHAVRHLR